ncbi:ribonuclease P protein subunit [Candidatus Woesearchaeota archaeon]|nr:ribonuclease P protein subunit [Candidatus Woesearchaeota archaeon]
MIDTKYLLKHEFIGLNIEIISSKNPSLIGMNGKIIDETKFTFKIKTQYGIKKIIKNQVKMLIKINNNKIEIDGNKLIGRAEERLKK